MCVGTQTPLYCPALECHYFLQGCATSGILSSLYYNTLDNYYSIHEARESRFNNML